MLNVDLNVLLIGSWPYCCKDGVVLHKDKATCRAVMTNIFVCVVSEYVGSMMAQDVVGGRPSSTWGCQVAKKL